MKGFVYSGRRKRIIANLVFNAKPKPNKANVRELASEVFIGVGWGGEGYKATMALRQPCQSRHLRAVELSERLKITFRFALAD
ncbi:MAG: hypothetical protein GXP37_05410 [Chloroflexi bacterium]|nr:hypothetical protein [Chloroflexota bacterium]